LQPTAIRQAIELYRIPTRAPSLRTAPLPVGIEELLRLLARDPDIELWAVREFSRSAEVLREAASFYAVQILLDHRSDEYRILGSDSSASRQQLRTHMAYLLQWLHPDHNLSDRNKALAMRVLNAWNVLKDDERRAEVDQHLARRARMGKGRPRRQLVKRAPAMSRLGQRSFWARRKVWIGIAIAGLIAFFTLPRQLPQLDLRTDSSSTIPIEFGNSVTDR